MLILKHAQQLDGFFQTGAQASDANHQFRQSREREAVRQFTPNG